MTKLEELRKLAEAATPGPWTWRQVAGMGARRFLYGPDIKQPILELDVGFPTCDFIAAANPATILDIIDRYQKLEALCKQQHESLSNVRQDLVLRAQFDSEDGGAILNIGNGVLRLMDEALAAYEQFGKE